MDGNDMRVCVCDNCLNMLTLKKDEADNPSVNCTFPQTPLCKQLLVGTLLGLNLYQILTLHLVDTIDCWGDP